jgi:hypothetical protein
MADGDKKKRPGAPAPRSAAGDSGRGAKRAPAGGSARGPTRPPQPLKTEKKKTAAAPKQAARAADADEEEDDEEEDGAGDGVVSDAFWKEAQRRFDADRAAAQRGVPPPDADWERQLGDVDGAVIGAKASAPAGKRAKH